MKDTIIKIKTSRTEYYFPTDRYYFTYHPGHIWFKELDDKTVEIGFDYFGQFQAGEILYLFLRPVGSELKQGETLGTVETMKWVGPLKMPLTGKIVEINQVVTSKPSLINEDPYNNWLTRIKPLKWKEEITSDSIIQKNDSESLKEYIMTELFTYNDPPI